MRLLLGALTVLFPVVLLLGGGSVWVHGLGSGDIGAQIVGVVVAGMGLLFGLLAVFVRESRRGFAL